MLLGPALPRALPVVPQGDRPPVGTHEVGEPGGAEVGPGQALEGKGAVEHRSERRFLHVFILVLISHNF